uniref:DAZ-associated protein 2 n=3 Tax=Anser TaxID=8842 RepID=A0A8B9DL85_ANSCY
MSAAYPGTSVFLPVAQSVAVGPIGSSVPMAYYPVGPVYPPGSTVLVEGGFDAGARFGAGGTASIPPPPPGCPPNAAQLAVMQGANVLVTQRKGNFFLGGSDGGYTIWLQIRHTAARSLPGSARRKAKRGAPVPRAGPLLGRGGETDSPNERELSSPASPSRFAGVTPQRRRWALLIGCFGEGEGAELVAGRDPFPSRSC